jgi:predicted dehydrogenase/threonine dehydrogenase-like Zn-dependent dehydrogenase
MLMEFGRTGLLGKAKAQPERVKEVLRKVSTDGLLATLSKVKAKLEEPLTIGYSSAGVVVSVGEGVLSLQVGDRIITNGPHAQYASVPERLCAVIPEGVSDDDACFTVIASIALQGIRLIQPSLGESIGVIGLGMLGLISCQLLHAHGVRVVAFDPVQSRVDIAKEFGAHAYCLDGNLDPVRTALDLSGEVGLDAVLVTAASQRSEPIHYAAKMSRQRGKVVVVGATGMQLNRADFYRKELTFQVSCSYGPGRYDPAYETKGLDYPIGYVRWTEQRNFTAVLEQVSRGTLSYSRLITHRIPFDSLEREYPRVLDSSEALGVLIQYPEAHAEVAQQSIRRRSSHTLDELRCAIIGAGSFVKGVLAPALKRTDAVVEAVVSAGGIRATSIAADLDAAYVGSQVNSVLQDSNITTVFIGTRHGSHANLVCRALRSGKHVYVEKPLCLTWEELREVQEEVLSRPDQLLMVGYNRRFSPHVNAVRSAFKDRTFPLSVTMTINAGRVPSDSWVHDPEDGGGRIKGEVCHFVDLAVAVTGSLVRSVVAQRTRAAVRGMPEESVSIVVSMLDGSVASINYLVDGHSRYPKERIEVFGGGKILQIDNFRALRSYGGNHAVRAWRQDKGHFEEIRRFVEAVKEGGHSPIPWEQIENVTAATLAIERSISEDAVIGLERALLEKTHPGSLAHEPKLR